MKKVLIIDDNADILELLTMIMELEGLEVISSQNGMETEKLVEQHSPDIILLDVLLGNIDGRYVCHIIKSNHKSAHIPIIMISASHKAKSLQQGYCKPDDFISKPFDMDDLSFRVRKLIDA